MSRIYFFLLCWLCLIAASAKADTVYFSQVLDGKGHGLNSVRALFADKQGFLWLGGDEGVFRFDGYQKVRVNDQATRGLYLDSAGTLWSAGTIRLSALEPKTFKSRLYPHLTNSVRQPEHEFIYDMLETTEGRQFFATKEGLSEYHRNKDRFTHMTFRYRGRVVAVTALSQAIDGRLFLGTDAGLFIMPLQKLKQYVDLPEPLVKAMRVSKIVESSDGSVLVGSNNGVYHISGKNGHVSHWVHDSQNSHSLSNNNVTALLVDNHGAVWVGTSNGLNLLAPGSEEFERFYHNADDPQGISNNLITDLFEDRQNNLFVATYAGINRFNYDDVLLHPASPSKFNGQSINNVWSLLEQPDGVRWVGTFGSGLLRYENGKVSNYVQDIGDDRSLAASRVPSLLLEPSGKLWVGTTKGLQSYNRQDDRFDRVEGVTGTVFDMQFDALGDLWLAASNGVYRLRRKSGDVEHFAKQGLIKIHYNQWVRSVLTLDSLVLAGSDLGLNVIDLKQKQVSLHGDVGSVVKIMRDSEHNIWVLAMEGLTLFEPKERSARQIPGIVAKGDKNGCNGMVEDNQKQLWLVCNNSLKVLDIHTRQLVNSYSVEDGVDLTGFLTGAQSIVKTRSGEVLVAERRGVTGFTPVPQRSFSRANTVALTQVLQSVDGSPIHHPDNPFNLVFGPPDQALTASLQKIEWQFSALDYARPKSVVYQYRLLGYEDHYTETTADNRRAVYTNLPGGDYVFEVTATTPGIGSSSARYRFSIAMKPWRSGWAYGIYVLTFLLLVYGAVQLRTRALRKRGQRLELDIEQRTGELHQSKREVEQLMLEREKLIENIYHQTRTPLQIMLGNIDSLVEGGLSVDAYAKRQTEKVHSLVHLTDRILDVARMVEQPAQPMQQVEMSALLTSLCLGAADVARAKGLSFDCNIDNDLNVWGSEDGLSDAVANIIDNSIKYCDRGGICISARRQGEMVVLHCADSGIGIPKQDQKQIFERYRRADNALDREGSGIGLAMVKQIIEAHSGSIEIVSEQNKGTRVTVSLPAMLTAIKEPADDFALPEVDKAGEDDADKPTVLLVEDNLELAAYMNRLLSRQYQVIAASNGKDGLDQAKQYVPDLIISDVMMSQMDGFELTKAVRADEVTCHIPLLLITAKNDDASREQGFAVGASDFINKPFKAPDLLNRVANQLALIRAVRQKACEIEAQHLSADAERDRMIVRYLSYIEDHYQDCELQIKAVCQALHVSSRQLERKVKHFLDMTPNALLNEYRLGRAREWIEQGKKPTEVYQLCGFSSHAYFSKRFKEKYGKLPSQYKTDS